MGLAILKNAHGLLDPDKANDALRRMLTSGGNTSNQTAAAIALGLRRDEWSRNALRDRVFSGASEELRAPCALALGLAGDCDAMKTLRELVGISAHRPALLREAVIALALLGDRDLTASLTASMQSARTQTAQIAFAQALALVGDARCLTPLSDLVTKSDVTVGSRAYAIRALGTVSDLDPLPWNASYSFDAQYLAASETLTNAAGTGILDPR
jgi:HEAT repeat protein